MCESRSCLCSTLLLLCLPHVSTCLSILSHDYHMTSLLARQWYYQTCTEFGYFQTTDSTHQPFGKLISLLSYTDVCDKVFEVQEAALKSAIASTNTHYGGTNVTGTNTVFPNGSIDPWHRLSVLKDIGPTVPSFYIHGTAHCANMYPPSSQDPPELTQARANITMSIGTWLE